MKKQKHFESEQAIIDAIDHDMERLNSVRVECERLEALRSFNHGLGPADEDNLRRLQKSARRIEDIKLPKLKRTLAAFRTETMPFIPDKAVVLE